MELGKHHAAFERRYDVIVIGSGAAGSSVALRLAQSGRSILVVERGDFLKPERHGAPDPIGRYLYDVVKQGEALSFVGGQTKFYGASLYRMRQSDFRSVDHETGVSPAWPISYADIEPYYDRAEALYRVHGSLEGDPSEPPHATPFPYPPLPHHPIVAKLVERLERTGTKVCAIPRGLDYRDGGACVLCSTCDAYYCQLDAKMDAEIAALRPALATGKVRLVTRTECLRLVTDSTGARVTSVVLRHAGATHVVDADTVVVCAGIPGSAALLRRSRTERHPAGLGNSGGALGRYMSGHSVGYIFPFVSWKNIPPIHSKTFAINAYHDHAPGWAYPAGIVQMAGQIPFWEMASPVIRPIAHFIGKHCLTCFYATEALPTRESGLVFDGDEIVARSSPIHNLKTFAKLRALATEAFRRADYRVFARLRPPYLWHETGTVCFGTDPRYSVTDPNCQIHGVTGLYVVDQSTLPSAGAVNTALTIIALALRVGDHIAGKVAAGKSALARNLPTNLSV